MTRPGADSAWPELMRAVSAAPYPVQVLPAEAGRARQCLARLEISDRSWLGALVLNSGGLAVDHGWLRVLGSGTPQLPDVVSESKPEHGLVVVAYDVLGGHFLWAAVDQGAKPTIHYFGPDALEYQDVELGYAQWLHAMLTGWMTDFYADLRWPGWEAEVAALPLDMGIQTYPPPSTREGADLSRVSRRPANLKELVAHYSGME